jgi:hypothetical protein
MVHMIGYDNFQNAWGDSSRNLIKRELANRFFILHINGRFSRAKLKLKFEFKT